MPTITIPTPLRPYAGENAEITVGGETVGAALQDLVAQHPDLSNHLYNEGQLRSFVNVFLGEEDIRYLDGEDTSLREDDRLRIIPSIAGGKTASHRQCGAKVVSGAYSVSNAPVLV